MANTGKFQAIIIDKNKKCHTNETFKIADKITKASSSVKLLAVQIDEQLNFILHISNICRSTANQFNALIRLKHFQDSHKWLLLLKCQLLSIGLDVL